MRTLIRLSQVLFIFVLMLIGLAASSIGQSAMISAAPAAPPTFTVNSIFDVPADFTGDPAFTICRRGPANSTCTLRAAIMNANRYVGGGATAPPSRSGGGLVWEFATKLKLPAMIFIARSSLFTCQPSCIR